MATHASEEKIRSNGWSKGNVNYGPARQERVGSACKKTDIFYFLKNSRFSQDMLWGNARRYLGEERAELAKRAEERPPPQSMRPSWRELFSEIVK